MEATDLELARALLIANKEATLGAVRNDEDRGDTGLSGTGLHDGRHSTVWRRGST